MRRNLHPLGLQTIVALLVAGLGGCAAVERARAAQDPHSAVPGERTPAAAEMGLKTSGTLTLARALDTAAKIHPSLLRARRNVEIAAARVAEVDAARWPSLSANASAGYRDQSSSSGGRPSHRFESYGFGVSWLLFDFGRTSALGRQAAANWLAAQEDERTAQADVDFNVRTAYFTLVKDSQLLEVAKEAVKQFDARLAQVREFVQVGTRIPYDQSVAEVNAGNARLALVQAEDALLLAQANLAGAIGLAETTDWVADAGSPSLEPPSSFDECWAQAQVGRPVLAAATAREQAASFLVDAQIAALYPDLALGLNWSAAGSSTPLPWSWSVAPSLAWTPFDGFRNLATIDEATAGLKAARADRALAEQQAWLDTRGAFLAIEDAKRRLEVTALVVKSAEENVRLAQGRFDVGKATSVDLTDAQQALIQARADDVQARADRDLATARLLRAIGATSPAARQPAAAPEGKP